MNGPSRESVEKMKKTLLDIMNISPSPQSIDYVRNKTQFQLHGLPTEKRHPATWNLSSTIRRDTEAGLRQIFTVDRDISAALHKLAAKPSLIHQAADSVSRAIWEGRRLYIYGCGSTGRLAKQMESAIWRPFWNNILRGPLGPKIRSSLPQDIENLLVGEMTGGDRALISSLEGFEDLALIGELQLREHGIRKGDIVFAITEGGETSSVIGTILSAAVQYGTLTETSLKNAKENLYFICNNPERTLRPFRRSRAVFDHPAISRIDLTTGPQAVTGSTRMQAATSETFVLGVILEYGIQACLSRILSSDEMASIGFHPGKRPEERLKDFDSLHSSITAHLEGIAPFTAAEADTYKRNGRSTYFAGFGLIPVFIDCSERSPTFHLHPLDTIKTEDRQSWVQVWTDAESAGEAWRRFLGRPFRGLSSTFYRPPFIRSIEDPFLREAALSSLDKAGDDQEKLYDFSLSEENLTRRGPRPEDHGILIAVDEEMDLIRVRHSPFARFISLFRKQSARLTLILLGEGAENKAEKAARYLAVDSSRESVLAIPLERKGDPLGLNRNLILKMLLNGHSTGVMARLGRIVGNTMTHVNPSNLKLVGRATSLILNHVNDTLSRNDWKEKYGHTESVGYAEANAVLFDAAAFLSARGGEAAEVELSIIRILEVLRTGKSFSWEQAEQIAGRDGLENYLISLNPSLLQN